MHPSRLLSRGLLFSLAALAALALLTGRARAQQLIDNDQIAAFGRVEFQFRSKVMAGLEASTPAQFELASKYYVLRVTNVTQKPDKVVREFDDLLAVVAASANVAKNRDAVGKLGTQMIARFKEVFALPLQENRGPVVSAAAMLPAFAKFRTDDIGDYLATVIVDDKMHDLIRGYAAKAVREFFPAREFTKTDLNQGTTKQLEAKKDRDARRIDALLKFIDRPLPKFLDPFEIDGFRYVRAEAVTSLAAAAVPAVSTYTKKVDGPAAVGLIKILSKKMDPHPTVKERLEAALGVCQFPYKYMEEYDPKIGIYLVGDCLSEVLSEYKKDLANIQIKGKEKKPPYLAWKVEAKRIELGLNDLVLHAKGLATAPDVQKLDQQLRPMLKNIYNYDNIDRDGQFRETVQKMRPASKAIFRDGKTALIEYDWEPAAPTEEKQ